MVKKFKVMSIYTYTFSLTISDTVSKWWTRIQDACVHNKNVSEREKIKLEVYREVLSWFAKMGTSIFFISLSPKLCYSLWNLILFDCMQLENLFCAHQDLLNELKRFLVECKGPTQFPNVPASASGTHATLL